MSAPHPWHSFLGGVSLAIPVHALLVFNGSVFGISGFFHRSVKGGDPEALLSTAVFLASGALVGLIDRAPLPALPSSNLATLALSGFLVGLGTKMGSGCTSGHMLAGVGRLSPRSIVATATFFAFGATTTNIFHSQLPPLADSTLDWTISSTGAGLLAAQSLPLLASLFLYFKRPAEPDHTKPSATKRRIAIINSVTTFALGLHLSGMTNAFRVLRFLILPFPSHIPQFDPSLAFLALGSLPTVIGLYQSSFGIIQKKKKSPSGETEVECIPALGGKWSIPCSRDITLRLVAGAALFGVGWGLAGICPGPALVDFGHALMKGSFEGISAYGTWLASAAVGGLLI